jgi:MEKHLA domain
LREDGAKTPNIVESFGMQDMSDNWPPAGYIGDVGSFMTFSNRLVDSYQRLTGSPLLPAGIEHADRARWMYQEAPFCVLAHSNAADPHFTYANKSAQICFEYSWEEFMALPSRLSAAPPDRETRQRLFDLIAREGFLTGYRGLRVARSGRQFWIEDGVVWRMVDSDGTVQGEAATFPRWQNV